MNTAQSVRTDKEKHPERYCSRCLWKTAKLDHAAQTYTLNANPCKRHQVLAAIKREDELAEAREVLAELGERD